MILKGFGCVAFFAGVLTLFTPEINPSAQRCLLRFFTGDFDF
jgi:hypothetical protein